MSALEVSYTVVENAPQLHLVREGEVSASSKRKAYARTMAQTRARTAVRIYLALGSVAAAFATAATTMVWAFLSIPNTPLP